MRAQSTSSSYFSLSVDELALALFLINAPSLGRELMQDAYETIDDDQLTCYLTAARNALLSRDLLNVNKNQSLILSENLERAVFPRCNFDRALHLMIKTKDESQYWEGFLRRSDEFTLLFAQLGMVYSILHGGMAELPDHLINLIKGFYSNDLAEQTLSIPGQTQLSFILELVEGGKKDSAAWLSQQGWPEDLAKQFFEDVAASERHCTIARIDADQHSYVEKEAEIPTEIIFLLQGTQKIWLFNYTKAIPDQAAEVRFTTKEAIRHRISALLA